MDTPCAPMSWGQGRPIVSPVNGWPAFFEFSVDASQTASALVFHRQERFSQSLMFAALLIQGMN